jgi:hypothetical protein
MQLPSLHAAAIFACCKPMLEVLEAAAAVLYTSAAQLPYGIGCLGTTFIAFLQAHTGGGGGCFC